MKTQTLLAVSLTLFVVGCSKPNVVGKWKCDSMVGMPAGVAMSGIWEFTDSECNAKYDIKFNAMSMKADAKYNYSLVGNQIAMKLTSIHVDPKSLPKELEGMASQIETQMETQMKKQKLRETFEIKDGNLLITEAGQTMTFTKVP
jgi:hypothetical protein